jgi:AAA+ superfamily predicted ATPase
VPVDPSTGAVEPWRLLASAVIEAEAVRRRIAGVLPRDFAGLVIDDAEVDRLLSELPGLDGRPVDLAALEPHLAPRLAERRAEFAASLAGDTPFTRIARHARLDATAAEVLALVAAVELSPPLQRLVGYVQDNVSAPRLWLSTLQRLTDGAAGALALDAALRRAELVQVEDTGPWAARVVSLPDGVAWALSGVAAREAALPRRAEVVAAFEGDADFLLVSGGDRTSRLRIAAAELREARMLVTPLPASDDAWRAVIRQASLDGLAVAVEVDGELPTDAAYWIERASHLAWAVCSAKELALEDLPRRRWTERRAPEGFARADDWERSIGRQPEDRHRLDAEQLRLVAGAYEGLGSDLDAAVRRLASGHLDSLAVRIRPRRTWDDLVLPDQQATQLRELAARYRHRGTVYEQWGYKPIPSAGIVALFAGTSGTGKTLAAEVVAGDLGLDLYKIDLSSVVSKFIGETEKNLERIFTAAAAANLVLFFDEADAVFGKRSEVSDAHDRYANIETAYLLQRLEMYDGIVILATNLQGNIDQAFTRRIHVSVDFPIPEEGERRRIWALSFPASAPCETIDLDFLARQFKIAGGNIRNAALTAAFLAADAGEAIGMTHVVHALEREFEKMGRLRTVDDFGPYYALTQRGGGQKGGERAASAR